jgi:hypothetical protein
VPRQPEISAHERRVCHTFVEVDAPQSRRIYAVMAFLLQPKRLTQQKAAASGSTFANP